MTTKEQIRNWLQQKTTPEWSNFPNQPVSHVIIAWDTFDPDGDYPIYVAEGQNVLEICEEHRRKSSIIMEVYSMKLDIESQLRERRAWHV